MVESEIQSDTLIINSSRKNGRRLWVEFDDKIVKLNETEVKTEDFLQFIKEFVQMRKSDSGIIYLVKELNYLI